MLSVTIHDFLTWLTVEGKSPLTITAYRSDLQQFQAILAENGLTELTQVDPPAVRRFLIELKRRSLSNSTLARKTNCLRSFFRYCEDEGYIQTSPMRRISAPKKEKRVPRYLTGADERRVLTAARRNGLQDFVVLETLALTGIRRAELFALQWQDIDFEAQTMRVRGKGMKERVLPLQADLARDLWQLLHTRLPLHSQAVFLTQNGTPMQKDSLARVINRAISAAGLTDRVTAHVFRHTFATRLLRQQFDLATVRDLLGHDDIATTSVYVHSSESTKRAAVGALGGILLGSRKATTKLWRSCPSRAHANGPPPTISSATFTRRSTQSSPTVLTRLVTRDDFAMRGLGL